VSVCGNEEFEGMIFLVLSVRL